MAWATLALVLVGCADRRAIAQGDRHDGGDDELRVTRGAVVRTVLLTGELVAEDGVALVTPNADIWPVQVRWMAEDGSEVDAGETVVEFDNSQLANNLDDLRAAVIEAENQLTGARARAANAEAEAAYTLEEATAQLEKAKLEADVPAELFAAREYEKRQLEYRKAQLAFTEAEQKLESTRGSGQADIDIQAVALVSARRQAQRAEVRIVTLSLTAPRDGLFLRAFDSRQGRTFAAGDNSWPGNVVASMPDLTSLMVEAQLYDVDDGRIAAGLPVRAVLDAYPDRVFTGTVRSIDQLALQKSRFSARRTFRVLLTLDELDLERMRPGMSVRLEVDARTPDDALTAPRRALDWSAAGARAFRRDGPVAVALGPCNAERCVIVSGLEEDDALVPVPVPGSGSAG